MAMMFYWIIFFCYFINVSCKPKVLSHDHVEEFLQNKTLDDVYELSQKYHRAAYLESQLTLSDSAQPNLVLADGAVLPCDPNWHQYSGTNCCYRKTDAMSTWYGGTDLCKALHPEAQMASFHSQAESEFVCKKYSPIHAWTGLSQTGTPGVWTYTDGTPDWHWFFAQASTMTAESSCVEMMDGLLVLLFSWSAKKGQTQPYSCTEEIASICKYCPKETTSTSTSTTKTTTTTVTTTTPTTTTTTPTTTTTTPTTTTTTPTTPTTTTTTEATTTPTTTTETTTTPTTTTETTTTTEDTTTTTSPTSTTTFTTTTETATTTETTTTTTPTTTTTTPTTTTTTPTTTTTTPTTTTPTTTTTMPTTTTTETTTTETTTTPITTTLTTTTTPTTTTEETTATVTTTPTTTTTSEVTSTPTTTTEETTTPTTTTDATKTLTTTTTPTTTTTTPETTTVPKVTTTQTMTTGTTTTPTSPNTTPSTTIVSTAASPTTSTTSRTTMPTTTTTKPTTTTKITTLKTTATATARTTTTTLPKTTTSKTISCTSKCQHPSVEFNGNCYKMCRGSVKFGDSCAWCGGTTVTVSSKAENDFISRVFGANDQTKSQIWIGNTESTGYLNWESGQPSEPNNGLDYCISMDLSAGPARGKHRYLPCQSTVVNSICLNS